MSAPR